MAARQLTLTVPEDLYDRMTERGLRPSAVLQEALEMALSGADQRSLADRLARAEKDVRGLKRTSRMLAALQRDVDGLIGAIHVKNERLFEEAK